MSSDIPIPGSTADFVSHAIIDRLRQGEVPAGEVARGLNTTPLVDMLRKHAKPEDVSWILEMLRSEQRDAASAALCVSLLRAFSTEPEVRSALMELWGSSDPAFQGQLLWRLLDSPDLPLEWHRRLRTFVTENVGVFCDMAYFYREGVQGVERRLSDPSFPASKRWAYLGQGVALLAPEDPAGAHAWLRSHGDGLGEEEQTFLEELIELLSTKA